MTPPPCGVKILKEKKKRCFWIRTTTVTRLSYPLHVGFHRLFRFISINLDFFCFLFCSSHICSTEESLLSARADVRLSTRTPLFFFTQFVTQFSQFVRGASVFDPFFTVRSITVYRIRVTRYSSACLARNACYKYGFITLFVFRGTTRVYLNELRARSGVL